MKRCFLRVVFAGLCLSLLVMGYEANAQGIFEGNQDIGEVAAEGSAELDGDTYVVTGNGAGIDGQSDAFHYVYKQIEEAFSLTANVFAFGAFGQEDLTKAMIMIRQDLTPESPYYGPLITGAIESPPANVQWRSTAGSDAESFSGPTDHNFTIEVVRVNGELRSYFFDSAGERMLLDSQTDFFEGPVYVGFAVTSGTTDGSVAEVEYSQVEEVPIPFSLTRTLPSFTYTPGEPLSGFTVEANVDEGATIDLEVTETPPEGWTVVETNAIEGSVSTDGGNIVWTANGASGSLTLNYTLEPPADAGIRGILTGSGTDGNTVLDLGTSLLNQEGQLVLCRKLASGVNITIDGDSSDWPLDSYGEPAELADLDPSENFINEPSTNAENLVPIDTGDHYVYNPDKILARAGAEESFETSEDDLDSTVYIAWDDDGFYVLNIAVDSQIGLEHGNNADPGDSWELDGLSLWFDTDNNRMPPNINSDPSSQFDLQLDYSIGAPLWAEERPDEEIPQNLEINIFRSALNTGDEAEFAIWDSIDRATVLDDNPVGEHESYVQEMFFPWGVFPSFQPDAPIGFNILWNDWDDTIFGLYRWHQSFESDMESARGLQFVSDNPLGEGTSVHNWSLF